MPVISERERCLKVLKTLYKKELQNGTYTIKQLEEKILDRPWPRTRVHIERLRSRPLTEEERTEAENYLKSFS